MSTDAAVLPRARLGHPTTSSLSKPLPADETPPTPVPIVASQPQRYAADVTTALPNAARRGAELSSSPPTTLPTSPRAVDHAQSPDGGLALEAHPQMPSSVRWL